jgi:hypothetical protein
VVASGGFDPAINIGGDLFLKIIPKVFILQEYNFECFK